MDTRVVQRVTCSGLWLNDIECLEAISQDDETKGTLKELAEDDTFLLVLEDYLWCTTVLH